jgi:hypothetical protein
MGVSQFLLQENGNKPFASETTQSETEQDIDGLEDRRLDNQYSCVAFLI